jgi:hypothetical protein
LKNYSNDLLEVVKRNIDLLKYLFLVILLSFIVIPILFNFLIMWDSGLAKGETGDWFTFYGNIVGGLIGGAFTYFALIKTLKRDEDKERKQVQEELETKIKECILNNKTYLNALQEVFIRIQISVASTELIHEIAIAINNSSYDFNTKPEITRYIIDKNKYKVCLDEIISITKQYEIQLKNDLKILSGNEFYYFQHNILTFNNQLNSSIKYRQDSKITDYEFLSNFIIWKENFGYRSILNKCKEDNDKYYQNYINEDMLGDYLRFATLPHIKG